MLDRQEPRGVGTGVRLGDLRQDGTWRVAWHEPLVLGFQHSQNPEIIPEIGSILTLASVRISRSLFLSVSKATITRLRELQSCRGQMPLSTSEVQLVPTAGHPDDKRTRG